MDPEKEEQRIRSLIADLENESSEENDNEFESFSQLPDDDSEFSDIDETQIQNTNNLLTNSDADESEEEEVVGPKEPNVPFYLENNGTTNWSYQPVQKQSQMRACNLITKLPGPIRAAKTAKSILDCFLLFFPKECIDQVVHYTNIKIRSVQDQYNRDRDCRETDFSELCAFFGILYMLGVTKCNKNNLFEVWRNDGLGIEIFRLVMGVNRFKFLQQMIRFDDISDQNRGERKKIDKLYCIRDFFEAFVKNCKDNYSHSEHVTVDEMLLNFNGRCSFRVFMPQKPGKFGIKVWACSDAKTFYTSNMEIFVGNQEPGPYHVNNSATAVVQRMVSHLENSGRKDTLVNFFTSVPLAESLLQKRLTIVGAMQKNKTEISPLFVAKDKQRPTPSSLFAFSTTTSTLVSYKPRSGKVVVLLSTLHNNDAIGEDSGDAQKPEVVTFYNKTKIIGVDITDALQKKYSVSRIAKRWPLVVFYYMLNIGGINSFIIYRHNSQDNLKRRQFLYSLGRSLVFEHCKRRLYEAKISTTMKLRIGEIFSLPRKRQHVEITQEVEGVEVRCNYCPKKKNRKTKTKCKSCELPICREHTMTVCTSCTETPEEED